MTSRKLINGEWWQILPHTEQSTQYSVVNTHSSEEMKGGTTNLETVRSFDTLELAKSFLNTQIGFVQDITLPGDDGFSLLYEKDGNEIIIKISRTAVSSFGVTADNTKALLEQMMFEPLIESAWDKFKFGGDVKNTIEIDSDVVKINGEFICSREECTNLKKQK